MKKENMLEIEKKVNDMKYLDTVKANIKALKESIKLFEEKGEEIHRSFYTMNSYSLSELKYFKRLLNKKLKELKELNV